MAASAVVIFKLPCRCATLSQEAGHTATSSGFHAQGQINLRDAVRRDCSFSDPKSGKRYQLGSKLATLLVRGHNAP